MPHDGFLAVQTSTVPRQRGPKVLVVGGGIGGLALAIGLGRAGLPCDMVEIKQEWAVYGVGLIQPGNALRAYGALGLLDECLQRGFLFTHQRHYDADGELMHEAPMPHIEGLEVVGTCGIARPVLHDILTTRALALGTQVRLGTGVSALRQDPDGVDVEFTDGTTGRYDVVVGADGVNSGIRRSVFGTDTGTRFTGQGCWRFTTHRPAEMTWSSAHYGPNKAGLVPLSTDSMYMYMLTPEPGNPWYRPEQLPGLMRRHLQGYKGLIADVASRIENPDDVVYRPLEVLLKPLPWHKGRVALIGDAAHSTTPHNAQGAAMAVEDAVVLSALLAENGEVEDTLRRFGERRFERCKLVVEASEQIGAWQLEPTATSQDEAIELHTRVRQVLAQPI